MARDQLLHLSSTGRCLTRACIPLLWAYYLNGVCSWCRLSSPDPGLHLATVGAMCRALHASTQLANAPPGPLQ
eukprot:3615348-Heterocapsa_arctica.AAC.1